ncbi:MAG: AAA family ATPase, partial [Candidatus Thermoplasmatota archaeon]|nr:AAA family ATPase [Candidatus Thermoplasmatota archaeon]
MRIVIGSVSKNAGKTSMIIGMAKAIGGEKSLGYMKPMGDRMLYRKKRQWDYDHALFHGIFGLDENLEDITLGFDHTKLRYMYDKDGLKKKLNETAGNVEKGRDVLFVEGGEDLIYGASVNLDVMSVSRYIDAELVLVVGGQDDKILDDLFFIQKDLDLNKVKLKGVIINKVKDVEEFKSTNMEMLEKTGLNILGIVPHMAALDYVTVRYLAEQLFAKVVAGEENMDQEIRH